jgi:methylase of polypeptide subunit release factors
MKGFVPTPPAVVDRMVGKLFGEAPPHPEDTLLDPGCGSGAFIEGVIRWCRERDRTPPRIHGVEPHPARCDEAREQFAQSDFVEVEQKDVLADALPSFDYVVGNPPYVPITQLSEGEKTQYRSRFATAHGRFDLYLLFFECAVELLDEGGRLVYVTPEKYLTVQTAAPLRRLLGRHRVREVELLAEDTFSDLVTYPAVTTLDKTEPDGPATLHLRDGTRREVRFSEDGASLAPQMYGGDEPFTTSKKQQSWWAP